MSVLTSGRTEPCNNNVGGLKELWLTSFIPYSAQLIVGYRDMLISSFPNTLIFEYEGQEKTFTEKQRDDKGYDQEITITFIKQDLVSSNLFGLLLKKKLRAIVVDRLGKIRVAGLHNGLDVELESTTNGTKGGFIGYRVTLTGEEPFSAPFLPSLPGSGFLKEGVSYDCLLASSDQPSSLMDKVSSCSVIQ